jgi:predicted amidohydrolase YtcJ
MQPLHASPIPNQVDVWSENIGPERASRGWIFKSIHDAGAHLAFGSDWPAVTLDPRPALNLAVNRPTPDASAEDHSYPDQRLPLTTAIEAYTSGGAYASFDEHRKGTIAPGMLADLIILSGDIFDAPPARLLDAEVTVTIFDGKVVYDRSAEVTAATK